MRPSHLGPHGVKHVSDCVPTRAQAIEGLDAAARGPRLDELDDFVRAEDAHVVGHEAEADLQSLLKLARAQDAAVIEREHDPQADWVTQAPEKIGHRLQDRHGR